MQIKNLTGKELRGARAIVPDGILRQGTLVLGCFFKEILAGLAVLMKRDADWVVTWLYVEPEYRKKGYGSALIQEAVKAAKSEGAIMLSMDLDGDSEEGRLMAFMLTQNFFCLHFDLMAGIQLTRDQLKKAVFFTDTRYTEGKKRSSFKVYSLLDLKSTELIAFLQDCEKRKNYLVSRADYQNADGRVSKVLVSGDKVVGVVLLERTSEKTYELQLGYVEKKHQMHFVSLVKAAALSLLEAEEWENLEFICMDSAILHLADHIFPEKEINFKCVITGDRWL